MLYILISESAGILLGDALSLKSADAFITRTLADETCAVLAVLGNTPVRTRRRWRSRQVLSELRSFRTDELGCIASDAEHLLCGRNGAPIGSFKVGFNRLLKEAGVLFGSDGKRRVPYSLRHTYATMRISEGVNVFQLAANMGTSVEMIDEFYGKKRMRDPKMATEITKTSLS